MKIKKKLIIFSILFLFGFGVFFGTFAKNGYFVNAATDNYFLLGQYSEHKTTASFGDDYEFQVLYYGDYDNNKYKIVFRVLSLDAYIGDYSVFRCIIMQSNDAPSNQYTEHTIIHLEEDVNENDITPTPIYEDLTDGIQLTYIFNGDLSSFYTCDAVYRNDENDNDLYFGHNFYLGYPLPFYENVIEFYENQGYIKGTQETQEAKFWFVGLFEGIQRFLDIEFMGISIGTIVLIPFAISFVWFIIRQFRGGGGD